MKNKLRLFLLVLISGFTKLPVMNLAKQHFASLREINTLSNHACNQKGNPPVADVVLVLNCCCCYLLASCGLLLDCPSPPGSAPSACPSPPGQLLVACPSPPGQGLLYLAFFFSFRGFNPWLDCEMVWRCYENLCSPSTLVLVE
jgi:hypothetical protein